MLYTSQTFVISFLFILHFMCNFMRKTVQISKNIETMLNRQAPEVLKIYKNYLELLEDIEIKD